MSRYINAEEAFNLLADAPQAIVPKAIWKVGIRSILDQCNAIDIVRCKECKYYNVYLDEHGCWKRCDLTMVGAEADCFCSWGERKESE